MEITLTKYFTCREEWRSWLEDNFRAEQEVWLVYPHKASGKVCIPYAEAVEEALCFGWIDSTMKSFDEQHRAQKFTPRRNKGYYSQLNKERIKWLWERDMIHPDVQHELAHMIEEEYVYPEDILDLLRRDEVVWENFNRFSEAYKRIRIAYIDQARDYPEHFEKRLKAFIEKTRNNKVVGQAGIEKFL